MLSKVFKCNENILPELQQSPDVFLQVMPQRVLPEEHGEIVVPIMPNWVLRRLHEIPGVLEAQDLRSKEGIRIYHRNQNAGKGVFIVSCMWFRKV